MSVDLKYWIEKKMQVDPKKLKKRFAKLEGTRWLFQAETEEYTIAISKTFKPKVETVGITNRCEDGKFVLFMDYDNIYKSILYKNLDNLKEKYPYLGNFFIAKTRPEEVLKDGNRKGSYHVVNFTKLTKSRVQEMLELTDVDEYFKKIPCKTAHKCNVLRIDSKYWRVSGRILTGKPKFIELYPDRLDRTESEWSYGHYVAFRETCGYKDPFFAYRNWDAKTTIELHKYSTPKVGK